MSEAVITGLRISPDGQVDEVTMTSGDTLRGLYEVIGCQRVDVVRLTTKLDMWIDEEGLFTSEENLGATSVAQAFGYVWQPYWGVVVLTEHDEEGRTTSLSEGVLMRIAEILGA